MSCRVWSYKTHFVRLICGEISKNFIFIVRNQISCHDVRSYRDINFHDMLQEISILWQH